MNKDQVVGAIMLAASVVGILVYAWLVYAYPIVILQITAFVAAAAVFGIFAWIGWTMATTPPLAPLDIEPVKEETTRSVKSD